MTAIYISEGSSMAEPKQPDNAPVWTELLCLVALVPQKLSSEMSNSLPCSLKVAYIFFFLDTN